MFSNLSLDSDPARLCSLCGAWLEEASDLRFPLCARCAADPKVKRQQRKKREARRAQYARVRAKRAGAEGRYTASDVAAIRRHQKNRCAYCRRDLRGTGDVVDHKLPLSRGGRSDAGNIHLTCPQCNAEKGTMTHHEFLRKLRG